MTAKLKTTAQQLLAGVRKGDFQALMALADYWEETPGHKKQTEKWLLLMQCVNYSISDQYRRRSVSRVENTRRAIRQFIERVNRIEKCWQLPRYIDYNKAAKNWTAGLAHALLAHARQRQAAQKSDEPLDS